jgi:hypothetical protein
MRYFLRTTDSEGRSYGGFQWPLEVGATVVAPDWMDSADCGNGLHGLENGGGKGTHLSFDADDLWWIVGVPDGVPVFDLNGKHKFLECVVIAFGDRKSVTDKMRELAPGAAVHGAFVTVGDGGTATAGYRGTATAGDRGTATAGDRGTATAGYRGTATAGNYGIIVIKHWRNGRYRLAVGYVGEGGIKPNIAYKLDENGNFQEA